MSNNGLCGLKNFGNSCWLNSSIQCIIASKYVSNFFLGENIKKYLEKNDILSIQYIKLLIRNYKMRTVLFHLLVCLKQ